MFYTVEEMHKVWGPVVDLLEFSASCRMYFNQLQLLGIFSPSGFPDSAYKINHNNIFATPELKEKIDAVISAREEAKKLFMVRRNEHAAKIKKLVPELFKQYAIQDQPGVYGLPFGDYSITGLESLRPTQRGGYFGLIGLTNNHQSFFSRSFHVTAEKGVSFESEIDL